MAEGDAAIEAQGKRLLTLGCKAVLIKGGHGHWPGEHRLFYHRRPRHRIAGSRAWPRRTPMVPAARCHQLSRAGLAKGGTLEAAVRSAKAYVTAAIAAADRFTVGHGHGPVHHFHAFY